MYKLVDVVCELMGGHYEYLNEKKAFVKEQLKSEEERFLSTIENGINIFNEELKNTKDIFSGEVAFKLYDTYGFPLDLTTDMLREKGIKVDEKTFDELMQKQKDASKAAWKGSGDKVASGEFKTLLDKFGENEFVGYDNLCFNSKLLGALDDEFKVDDNGVWLLFDKTPFYATSGGQNYDKGEIYSNDELVARVLEVEKFYGLNLCKVEKLKNLQTNEIYTLCVDSSRRNQIAAHHSATHLLHYALREVLGDTATQAGSFVDFDRLRFDFNYIRALSPDELKKVESIVNDMIFKADTKKTELLSIEEAKQSGAIALFDTKYGEKVRVLTLGKSKELCGGTHVENTANIGLFAIVKESGVSAGVRRIEAVASKSAYEYLNSYKNELENAKLELKTNDIIKSFDKLKNDIKELKSAASKGNQTYNATDINGVSVCVSEYDGIDIKASVDEFKNKYQKAVIVLISQKDDKVNIAVGSKDNAVKAGALAKEVAMFLGGNGGGRDDFATAGAKDTSKIPQALDLALKLIKERLA